MPFISDKIRLSETQDRRRKLTETQKKEIKELYESGSGSLRSLARLYEVSHSTILLIVNENSMEKRKNYRKENWKEWQRDKEERSRTIREHRRYKQSLYLDGKLKPDNNEK